MSAADVLFFRPEYAVLTKNSSNNPLSVAARYGKPNPDSTHQRIKRRLIMIRIGIVGIGFMGRIHYLASKNLKGAKVTAVCSRDPKKLAGDWSATRGNFGPPPGQIE